MTNCRTIVARVTLAVLALAQSAPGFAGVEECNQAFDFRAWVRVLAECRPLAEQGNPVAQSHLAWMYNFGVGVPQDYAEAAHWYRMAARQGDSVAQIYLGELYYLGRGVPQDYTEALRWYQLAAEQGEHSAQNNLGVMYVLGRGVAQDYVQAHFWYNLAAAQGDEIAEKNRDRLANQMSLDQIAEAQRLASEWKPAE